MFSERLAERQVRQVIEVAQRYHVELRYWQLASSHLYVFEVPWNGQPSGNLDEAIYRDLEEKGLGRFDLGYASDYEWEVFSQEVLYWPQGEVPNRRGDKP